MTWNFYPTDQNQGLRFVQQAQSGSSMCMYVKNANNTGLTADTEFPLVYYQIDAVQEWTAGVASLPIQRHYQISTSGISFDAPYTCDYAATFSILAGPYQRTNATVTNSAACWHDSWQANNGIASEMVLGTPGIENGTAGVTERAALTLNGWATTGFGNQTANITNIYGLKFNTYLINSTTNVRTITGNLAQLYIAGLPTLGANISFAGTSYAIFVDAGPSRFDDHHHFGAGVAVTGTLYSVGRDADGTNQLHFNVPTSASFEFSVNDGAALVLNATNLKPGTNDGIALGLSGTAFSDLFLASGAVVDWAAGDITLTHASNLLTFAGGVIEFDSGIQFAAAGQSVLSNYTEGTFSPTVTLVGGAGNTTPVYTTNTGRYTRIGNRVFVDVYLTGDGGDEGAGSGTVNIALPVTASASHPTSYFPLGYGLNNATDYEIWGQIQGSATTVELSYFSAIQTRGALTGADQNNATRTIRLKFSYEV